MAQDVNDYRPGDTDNSLLRKILDRLKAGISATIGPLPPITIQAEVTAY